MRLKTALDTGNAFQIERSFQDTPQLYSYKNSGNVFYEVYKIPQKSLLQKVALLVPLQKNIEKCVNAESSSTLQWVFLLGCICSLPFN